METDKNIKKKGRVGRPSTGIKRTPASINLPFDLIDQLRSFSEKNNVPMSSIVEKSLRIFFEYNS